MYLVFLIKTVKAINDNLTSIFSKHAYRNLGNFPQAKKKLAF